MIFGLTGSCVKELDGHRFKAGFTDGKSTIIASSDSQGAVSVWNLEVLDEAMPLKVTHIPVNHLTPLRIKNMDSDWVHLGRNFMVSSVQGKVSFVDFGV